jgi:hypothetical protein
VRVQRSVTVGAWLAAVALGPALAGALAPARGALDASHVTLLLVLVVALVSAAGKPPAGVVAAVTSGLAYDVFWTEPYGSLRVLSAGDVWTVVLLVVVGSAVELLGWWGRREHATADRRAGYLGSLRAAVGPDQTDGAARPSRGSGGTAGGAAGRSSESTSGARVQTEQALVTLLGVDRVRFVLDEPGSRVLLHPGGDVTRDGRLLRPDVDGLPTDTVLTVPAYVPGHPHAHFAVVAASSLARPTREQRQVAALLARLAGTSVAPDGRPPTRSPDVTRRSGSRDLVR